MKTQTAIWLWPSLTVVLFALFAATLAVVLTYGSANEVDFGLGTVLVGVLVVMFFAFKASHEKYLIRTGRM